VIGIVLRGWDGSVWDLRTGPVRMTNEGVEGLGSMDFEVFVQETAARHGQRMTGWRGKPRDFLLPILVGPFPDDASWYSLTKRWWRLMKPDRYNTLEVTAPDGTVRKLDIRFVDDGNQGTKRDPSIDLIETFAVRYVADNPWFYGVDFGRTVRGKSEQDGGATTVGVNFFGGKAVVPGVNGKGTPLALAPSQRKTSDEYTNPGDDDAWPTYTFGAMTRFKATIGDGIVSATSLTVNAGEQLIVETNPLRQVATLRRANGVETNVTRRLDGWGFRSIPPEATSRISLEVEGTGDYSVALIPHYFRGW
jgi:hypothetical protein